LLLGEKLAASSLDQGSLQDFKLALNKIRSVVDQSEKDHLSALDDDVEVIPTGSHFPIEKTSAGSDGSMVLTHQALSGDRWLRECRTDPPQPRRTPQQAIMIATEVDYDSTKEDQEAIPATVS
jgi:hypothetical protein